MRKHLRWILLAVLVVFFITSIVFWTRSIKKPTVAIVANGISGQPKVVELKNNLEEVYVTYVIDGDTIILKDGRHVRYIGIDTPELNSEYQKVVVREDVAARKAKEANEKLVLWKKVVLEKDVQELDQYGRTLAYVWVDGKMVNEELLKEGVAVLMIIEPNVRYVERFKSMISNI